MAEQTGLSTDPGKINPTGASPEALTEYQNSLEAQIKSLEDRYSNPNWFKVAAGFLKPQLGGFAASLGSASEALGENVEAGRQAALPIAQMRSQLAQSRILTGQNQEVATEIADWQNAHPGEMPTPGQLAKWSGKAPGLPAVKSLMDQQESSSRQNTLLTQQAATQFDLVSKLRQSGKITQKQYNDRLMQINATLSGSPTVPNQGPANVGDQSGAGGAPVVPPPAAGTDKPPVKDATQDSAPGAISQKPLDYSGFKIIPTYSKNDMNPNAVTEDEKADNAQVLADAKDVDAEPKKQFQALQAINNPLIYSTADKANKSVLQLMDNNPKMAAEVTDLIRNAGPFAAALAKGIGIHFASYGASIDFSGLEKYLEADLSKAQRNYLDGLMNNLAKSTYMDMKLRGIDPNNMGADRFGQALLQETGLQQGSMAIRHAVAGNDIRMEEAQKMHQTYNKYLPEVRRQSLTPFHDIVTQHPAFQVRNKVLNGRLKAEDDQYNKAIGGVK